MNDPKSHHNDQLSGGHAPRGEKVQRTNKNLMLILLQLDDPRGNIIWQVWEG